MKFLPAKLSIPEPSKHFIFRHRLATKFSESKSTKLFLLIAPAGYGKTTLAVQFFSKYKNISKSWFHIDRQDIDPKRFLAYLIEALSISISISTLKESNLTNKLLNENASTIEITDDLCFLLQEYNGRECWLVLDNWELVNAQPEICQFITQLISYGGSKLKIIINSRVKPSLHIRKLQISKEAVIINQKELAFNLTEFDNVIKVRLK